MSGAEDHLKLLENQSPKEWLGDDDVDCPCLTVNYKRGGKGGKQSQTRYQTIAAAMLWFCPLKRLFDALHKSLDTVRHYLITISDAPYIKHVARLQPSTCAVATLAEGSLKEMHGLEEYIRWSNTIHSWGLGVQATASKNNIVELLRKEEGLPLLPTPLGDNITTPPCSNKDDKADQDQ